MEEYRSRGVCLLDIMVCSQHIMGCSQLIMGCNGGDFQIYDGAFLMWTFISMICLAAVTSVLTHWSYCGFAPSHQYHSMASVCYGMSATNYGMLWWGFPDICWWAYIIMLVTDVLIWHQIINKHHADLSMLVVSQGSYCCISGKLWYLQHNCVGDTIVYH